MAVTNQDQTVSGSRIMLIPRARRSSVVVMKFKAPSREAMQNRAMLTIHKSSPRPRPGPAEGIALSGG
jgi:hypothetical protein